MSNDARTARLIESAEERFAAVKRLQELGLICDDGDFVPSVHYPPITQYPPTTPDEFLADYTLPDDGHMDIYVHIPFCLQHCIFCHYPGMVGKREHEKEKYIAYLEKEMDLYLDRLGVDKLRPRSILIGGGTPTFLDPPLLRKFLESFSKRVDLTDCKQFNYDVDPNSLLGSDGLERLAMMKEYGVDRLTIGVQSLDDNILKIMNRAHDAKMAKESIDNTNKFGFDLNIEFIYGHPGQDIENWIKVMDEAVTLPVHEIQIYRLKVLAYGDRQGVIINKRTGAVSEIPDFKTTMMMKQMAIDILAENGFNENLRRVYTREKKRFSHYAYNQCCNLYDQIGFGTTAFSSLRNRFSINTMSFDEYYEKIDNNTLPFTRGYVRPPHEQMRWAIVLPMKNRDVRKKDYQRITGVDFDTVFPKKRQRLEQYGLIEDKGSTVSLTDLGKFVADEVVEQFNSKEYVPFPNERYAQGPLNPYLDNDDDVTLN